MKGALGEPMNMVHGFWDPACNGRPSRSSGGRTTRDLGAEGSQAKKWWMMSHSELHSCP